MTLLNIQLPPRDDATAWRQREWLLTNGLGGYASGTLAGVCTRRYHGLFVPNLQQPRGRHGARAGRHRRGDPARPVQP